MHGSAVQVCRPEARVKDILYTSGSWETKSVHIGFSADVQRRRRTHESDMSLKSIRTLRDSCPRLAAVYVFVPTGDITVGLGTPAEITRRFGVVFSSVQFSSVRQD